jgi:hypothetical protein
MGHIPHELNRKWVSKQLGDYSNWFSNVNGSMVSTDYN